MTMTAPPPPSTPGDDGPVPLRTLVARAAPWTGPRARDSGHTQAIVADLWDRMAWRETHANIPGLRRLADDLADDTDHASDLVRDLWTALYQHHTPALRDPAEMTPSRRLNHQAVTLLLTDPDFTGLRTTTRGDACAAALALIGQHEQVEDLLKVIRTAQRHAEAAAQARTAATRAAQNAASLLWQAAAAADDDDLVPAAYAAALDTALTSAMTADSHAKHAAVKARAAARRVQERIARTIRSLTDKAAADTHDQQQLLTAWGITHDQQQRMDYQERADLAHRLNGHRVRRYADLIGRFRSIAHAERAQRILGAGGEIVGITLGDDIARAIPGELAALAVPALRADLIARMAEGRLLSYQTRGQDRAGRGPLIICLDASLSMNKTGTNSPPPGQEDAPSREAWAKALTLALIGQAADSTPPRACTVLRFSRHIISRHHFPAGPPDPQQILTLAETGSPGTKTDYRPPLNAATQLLQTARTQQPDLHGADIIFITDGEHTAGDLTNWLDDFHTRKTATSARVFGIAIAAEPSHVLRAISDHVHTITDLTDPGTTREIFRAL